MHDIAILAVDPGSCTGWACSDGTSGAVDFRKPKPKGIAEPAWHGLLGLRFDVFLDAQLSRTGAGILVLERQMSHGTSAHVLLGLRMIALLRGKSRGLAVEECWVSSWQPWARANLGWIKGDDAGDARAMLAYWTAVRLPRMVA